MMKKVIMLAVLVFAALFITACGSDNKNNKTENKPVVIYCATEDERVAFLQSELKKKFPDQEIVFQVLGTGQMLSKLQAEGKDTDCDIFYDLEVNNAEYILSQKPDMFYDLSGYDFSKYDESVIGYTKQHKKYAVDIKTDGAFLVNKKVLKEKNLLVPKSYNDLLKAEYKGLISLPNPKSSGTGYCFYNGMNIMLGDNGAKEYFKKLNVNIKEYTTSGAAPIKSVQRGDAAIGVGMLWQCVEYANQDKNLEIVLPDNKVSFNLFVMGMINGKEKNPKVKAVFDFLYNDLNNRQVAKFVPDKIMKKPLKIEVENYPTDFQEIISDNIFDYKHKQNLLDKWEY